MADDFGFVEVKLLASSYYYLKNDYLLLSKVAFSLILCLVTDISESFLSSHLGVDRALRDAVLTRETYSQT